MHLLHLSSNKIGEFFATICLTDFGGIVANGKAGAYFPGLDQFEATRLRFRTHQDALDFADHIVQKRPMVERRSHKVIGFTAHLERPFRN